MPFLNESDAARWFVWPNIALLVPLPLATAAVAWIIWRGLANEAELTPFVGAMVLFVLTYVGVAISHYPMIVPHHFTLWQAAASERTQTLVLLPVILMYIGWSYWVFRGKVRSDFGYD
jgi:cytochrome d ubiquinol oxidase subunit II